MSSLEHLGHPRHLHFTSISFVIFIIDKDGNIRINDTNTVGSRRRSLCDRAVIRPRATFVSNIEIQREIPPNTSSASNKFSQRSSNVDDRT